MSHICLTTLLYPVRGMLLTASCHFTGFHNFVNRCIRINLHLLPSFKHPLRLTLLQTQSHILPLMWHINGTVFRENNVRGVQFVTQDVWDLFK
jgi:hypothetical protein